MAPLTDELIEKLYSADKQLKAAGMGELSNEEIRKAVQSTYQQRPQLAPMPRGNVLGANPFQSQAPIAGFQGNSVFPNQAGTGLLNPGQNPPPPGSIQLNPMGQPMQQGVSSQYGGQPTMLAQGGGMPGQPMGGRGFTTNIQIGEDGQVQSLTLKKAMQKRMQQGGMA